MIFEFCKVTGPNMGSKFVFSKKKPTRLLGVVIIRLGARAMKKKFQDLTKSGPPNRGPLTGTLLRAFKRAPQGETWRHKGKLHQHEMLCYASAMTKSMESQHQASGNSNRSPIQATVMKPGLLSETMIPA